MFGRFATRWSNFNSKSFVKLTGVAAGLTSVILIHQHSTPTASASTTITSSSSSASASLEERIRMLYPDRSPPVTTTSQEVQSLKSSSTLADAIGSTPLIALKSLEKATGCIIWAKAEHLNPGFSIKDRAAKYMLDEAEHTGQLKRGQGVVIEATGGNTGIGVSLLCAARNYRCILCMPQAISQDKINMMRAFGAEVRLAPAVPFGHHDHYYSVATRLAQEIPNSIFTNQFENIANVRGHYETTGPEIWTQTRGHVDGVCVSAGTGGTIAGLSLYLKQQNPRCVTALIDCAGSGLYSYLTQGELKPTPGTTIAEGIGTTRLTANFRLALIDRAYAGYDQEAIDMAYYLLKHEGLWVGPSAALNVVGAVKLARELGPGHQIVTVLCDSGDKYKSSLYDSSYLASRGLHVREQDSSLKWIS